MKLTTRSELISQGYEIQQKLMPLIEQVRIILLCSYLHVIGHCVHLCTGADDNQHSWFGHSPWCRIIYKVRAQSHSRTHSCDFTVCIYIVRLFHPTTVLCLKSDISGSEWCCHVNGTSIYVVLFVYFSRRQQQGEPVYSKALKVSGLTWRLKVYPVRA